MPTSKARHLIEQLVNERQDGAMRFDLDCRVEVWVTQDELESDRRVRKIANGAPGVTDEKIQVLKNIAQDIAAEKLRSIEINGVQVTCDSLALSNVNIDRIDWNALALSDAEKQAAEDAENADMGVDNEDRLFGAR